MQEISVNDYFQRCISTWTDDNIELRLETEKSNDKCNEYIYHFLKQETWSHVGCRVNVTEPVSSNVFSNLRIEPILNFTIFFLIYYFLIRLNNLWCEFLASNYTLLIFSFVFFTNGKKLYSDIIHYWRLCAYCCLRQVTNLM